MKKILVILAILLACKSSFAQQQQQYFWALNQSSCSILGIDSLPTSIYSFRQLNSCRYSGNCVTVRRQSDSATSTFAFINGFVDTAGIKSFIGSSDAYVKYFYDQTGHGDTMTQTIIASQPKIATAGALLYKGGHLCIQFDGTNDYLVKINGSRFEDENTSIFSVGNRTGGIAFGAVIPLIEYLRPTPGGAMFNMFPASNRSASAHYASTGGGYVATDIGTATTNLSLSTSIFYYPSFMVSDGTSTNTSSMTGAITGFTNPCVGIGAYLRSATNYYAGQLCEAILYNTDRRTERTIIEANIKSYYGL